MMLRIWKRKETLASRFKVDHIVPIVSNAAIATAAVGDGRMVPLLILDITNRPDIDDFIRAHDELPPGDATSTWASLFEFPHHISLLLEFTKPFETKAILNFELAIDGIVVDLIMNAGNVYLQAGKPGDRLHQALEEPRIIAEIGTEMPKDLWESIWQKAIRRKLRAEGISRTESKRIAPEYMSTIRATFKQFRYMPGGG